MNSEIRRSKRRVTVCETSRSEPFLFVIEPKQKCSDVKMYHVYRITETFGPRRTMAIINIADVCTDMVAVKRAVLDGAL